MNGGRGPGDEAGGAYDAGSIAVLPGLEAVRRNPSMYIGSTGTEGLHHLVWEVVDNAVDESLAGWCTRIDVVVGRDGSCSVEDDGRGIPVDVHPTEGIPACEVVLTRLHAGGKFGNGSYFRSAGIHGVGLSSVNALSARLDLDVWRGGVHHRQAYERGRPVTPLRAMGPTGKRGTRIRFVPDPEILEDPRAFSWDLLSRRLEDLAFLHPGIRISVADERQGYSQVFQYTSGILGFLERLCRDRGALHPSAVHVQDRTEDMEIDLALQWTRGYGEEIRSYVNSICTVHGGAHVAGFKAALARAVNAVAVEARLLRPDDAERINALDVLEGLVCVLSVKMSNPRFEGQTKTRLTSREAGARVEAVVEARLGEVFALDPRLALLVVNRAIEASRARSAARRASEHARYEAVDVHVSDEVYQKQFGIRSRNWHESAAWITDREILEAHVRHVAVGPDARLLDVCCGSGVVGASFSGRVARTVGLDITPEMVALARTRLDEVHQGTVYAIPFPDASFDLVVTREVLHILARPERAMAEAFRVLRPGGQVIVGQILPYGPEDGPWMFRVFKKKQPLIFSQFHEEDFRALLLGSGFASIEMTEIRRWESISRWIDTHETTPLHRHEIRELFRNAPPEVRAAHPFEILPSGEIRDLWRWCVFSARKPAS